MKIQFKNIGFSLIILLVSALSFSSCQNDVYNEHYSIDPGLVSDKTLWQTIQSEPDLKIFAWALKKTGYDKVLSNSQMYTVWAPNDLACIQQFIDTTDANVDTNVMLREFVQNHISRFSYSASGTKASKILLLNKKLSTFEPNDTTYSFSNVDLVKRNLINSNGILHVIENTVPFFNNVWESLRTDVRFDSISNHLHSFDRIFFDAAHSIPGGYNEFGETVYLDSVKINYNTKLFSLGALNVEDSSYTAIFPTNTAWNTSYSNIKSYFQYYATTAAPSKLNADTLQRKNTWLALTKDLVFSNSIQHGDSLISASRNIFRNAGYLTEGLEKLPASNGSIYIADELKFNHWESWNKQLLVESENSNGRITTWANIFDRSYPGTSLNMSGNRYVEIVPTTSSVAASVTFDIPHTLSGSLNPDNTIKSGAAYNIYCVFAPTTLKSTELREAKVSFTLFYMDATGKKDASIVYDNKVGTVKNYYKTETGTLENPRLSKILIASNVTFPYSEFGFVTPFVNVKLKVSNVVTAAEVKNNNLTRDLLIDCIILEPVH